MYFYSNNCSTCSQQDYVMTYLRDTYPGIRIYSFDYKLDNPALHTLISLYKVKETVPAIVINDKVYNGFLDKDKLESYLPAWMITTATTTVSKK